jgi:uncharacterized protein (TIGR02678 family)
VSRDDAERRTAFTALLGRPVLDRSRHPELFGLVRNARHRPVLTDWFASRLGYRLVVTETAARLFRPPLHGRVLAPARVGAPSRRVAVLALLAAACAESAEDVTTTQDLSDRVRLLTARDDVDLAPYDPDRFAERLLFVAALELLVELGALRRLGRDDDAQGERWAHRRTTVGAAFDVDRSLLLRAVDPAGLGAVLAGGDRDDLPGPDDAARFGVVRRIVELPVCLLDDLTTAERTYLTSQRHRIIAWCEEMTGWTVEQRQEGLALVASDEADTDVPFPRLRAVDFAAIMMLDQLPRRAGAGSRIGEADLLAVAADVRLRHPRAMTKDLDSDGAVRDRAVEVLAALDMIRPLPEPGTWWLSPAAARYRDPEVVAVTARIDAAEIEETG